MIICDVFYWFTSEFMTHVSGTYLRCQRRELDWPGYWNWTHSIPMEFAVVLALLFKVLRHSWSVPVQSSSIVPVKLSSILLRSSLMSQCHWFLSVHQHSSSTVINSSSILFQSSILLNPVPLSSIFIYFSPILIVNNLTLLQSSIFSFTFHQSWYQSWSTADQYCFISHQPWPAHLKSGPAPVINPALVSHQSSNIPSDWLY